MKEPLYLLTALYVLAGLGVGGYGAIAGDLLAACLGLFIVGGALCSAVVFHTVSRLSARISVISEKLDELQSSLVRVDGPTRSTSIDESENLADARIEVIDLAAVGTGNLELLAGASLERSTFPRLVHPSGEVVPVAIALANGKDPKTNTDATVRTSESNGPTQTTLRNAFAERIRERDYRSALEVGNRILEFFPQEPIAQEFQRIKPLLVDRLTRKSAASNPGVALESCDDG